MRPLTIGMCVYDDYDGAYFTIQSLIMHQTESLKDFEILVVDNNSGGAHSQSLERLIKNIGRDNVRLVKYNDRVGTAARQKIFDEASTDFVMVIDCHVIMPSGTISRLIKYLENNPEEKDILHGPILEDSQRVMSTHMNDQWRGGMWGTWGVAWKFNDLMFSVKEVLGKCVTVSMPDGLEINIDGISGTDWSGHIQRTLSLGARPMGTSLNDDPFYIPGHGLGLFVCSKSSWPGFNKDVRGFGGDEMYVHKKHENNGHRVKLLPFLRWLHKFDRPNGVKYPYNKLDIVRNYVFEFREMGWDLEVVYNHFVRESKIVSDDTWNYLIKG